MATCPCGRELVEIQVARTQQGFTYYVTANRCVGCKLAPNDCLAAGRCPHVEPEGTF